jgi:anti-sigma regulatory factor (Ser/Thr protein kinase)
MAEKKPFQVKIKFPGDIEYIPAVRKYVSEMLQVCQFSPKFAFRSEIIVDEICNNAVTYGCQAADATVEVICHIFGERIEFEVKDSGGKKEDLKRLRASMKARKDDHASGEPKKNLEGLGLEIVRMLSEKVDVEIDANNLTSIRVLRLRENAGDVGKETAQKNS